MLIKLKPIKNDTKMTILCKNLIEMECLELCLETI